jgi:putative phage-type endonuclease
MLNKTIEILEHNIGNNNTSKLSDLSVIKKQIYHDLQRDFADVTQDIVDEIFSRLFVSNYKFVNKICFDDGKNCFREYEEKYPDIKVPSKHKKLFEHFEKLKNLPQPAQRSKEWYDYRYNRITASDAAAAIDLNPYEPVESFILKKCDPNFPFRDNATVFHGKKYEPTATMIYEHIYNTRIFEFGALPSDKYTFLGASPDGISSKYTLDNKFSERLGTMLEIKCPVTRDIHTHGKIVGDICPFYYYCQVQQQLACCDLDVCDFWQCKISEYKTREEYLSDNCKSCSTTVGTSGPKGLKLASSQSELGTHKLASSQSELGTHKLASSQSELGTSSTKIDVDNRLKKGIILEFYPKNFVPEFEGDLAEWKSKYIIPKRLDMDESQYDNWTTKMLDQYKTLYPDIAKDYYFYRIIYWKLEMSHNVSVNRDDKFLANIIPILTETWNKILYYREHQEKLDELKQIVDKRKKYIKFNTGYTIHNDIIVNNKFNILEKSFDLKQIIESKPKTSSKQSSYKSKLFNKDHDSDYCDFIDNEECDFIDEKSNKTIKPILNKVVKQTNLQKESVADSLDDNNTCDFLDD